MELRKNIRKKGRERTLKLIEEQRRKEEFFSELGQQIEDHFS